MNNPHFVPPLVVLFCLVSDILMIFFFFAFCMRYISFDVNKLIIIRSNPHQFSFLAVALAKS